MNTIQKRKQRSVSAKEQKLKILSICSKMVDEVSELLRDNCNYATILENLKDRGIIHDSSSVIDMLSKLTLICDKISQSGDIEDGKFDPQELPSDTLQNIIEICQEIILSRRRDATLDR